MIKRVLRACVPLVLTCGIQACTPIHDLDAPCKNFGRYCSQELVNIQEYQNFNNNNNKEKE